MRQSGGGSPCFNEVVSYTESRSCPPPNCCHNRYGYATGEIFKAIMTHLAERERGREGGRGREREREGGREREREGGREGEREGGREGGREREGVW